MGYLDSVGRIAFAAVLLTAIASFPALSDEMKYPDNFAGTWRNAKAGQRGNPWDITKPMGLGQEAPLTPEYQAIFEASLKAQAAGGQGKSNGTRCALSGMPKLMSLPVPMEVLIRPAFTYFVFLHGPIRRIYTDGRDRSGDAATFMGTSTGKWIDENHDGRYDVLEIETRNFLGPRVYESTGLPLHEDNQTIVRERLYLDKNDKNILHDEITTIDHALTRPWTVIKQYVHDPDPKWIEYNCNEANNHVAIGKEEYFLSGDGLLMPVKPDQPAPDLRYFKQK